MKKNLDNQTNNDQFHEELLQEDIPDYSYFEHIHTKKDLFEYLEKRKQYVLGIMVDYYKNQQWQDLIDMMRLSPDLYGITFPDFFSKLPEQYKRKIAISAYEHHGDAFPCVRKAVRSLPKCGKWELPPEIAEKETINIFRAGEESLHLSKYRLSWTTNIETAKWFFRRKIHFDISDVHLYSGMIRTKDIIAYNNEINEFEVLQYRKVYDISDITSSLN